MRALIGPNEGLIIFPPPSSGIPQWWKSVHLCVSVPHHHHYSS
jgi:hypothetical protein